VSEAIVFELDVRRDLAHCYVSVHSTNTLIRVKSAFYRNHSRNYSLVNNFYFVNTSTLDLYDH